MRRNYFLRFFMLAFLLYLSSFATQSAIATTMSQRLNNAKNSIILNLHQSQKYPVYTPYRPLKIEAELINNGSSKAQIQLQVKLYDLINRKWLNLPTKKIWLKRKVSQRFTLKIPQINGVFDLHASVIHNGQKVASRKLYYVYSPAPPAKDLPDEWPLGFHLNGRTGDDMVMPGVKWVRNFAHWYTINPKPGEFTWGKESGMDRVMHLASKAGAKVLWVLKRPPAFSVQPPEIRKYDTAHNKNRLAMAPTDMKALDTILHEVKKRYGQTFGGVEIWNEGNVKEWFQDTPENYVAMAKTIRKWRDREAPWIKLVGISMSSGMHSDWVKAVINAGILPLVDKVSLHPYDEMYSPYSIGSGKPTMLNQIDMMQRYMCKAGLERPIWLTEGGLPMMARLNGVSESMTEVNKRLRKSGLYYKPDKTKMRSQAGLDSKLKHRHISEERAAAIVVRTVSMMYHRRKVEKIFFYSLGTHKWGENRFYKRHWLDPESKSPMLPVVSFGVLAHNLVDVIWSAPVETKQYKVASRDVFLTRFKTSTGFLSIVFSQIPGGKNGKPGPHPMVWQDNYPTVDIQVPVRGKKVSYSDLWGREQYQLDLRSKQVTIPLTEVPIYLHEK